MDLKCYLFLQDTDVSVKTKNQTELRILHNYATEYSTYKQFIKNIQTLFSESLEAADELKTYWQNEEDELVSFSSTEELHCAFDLHETYRKSKKAHEPYFLKVYIKRTSKYAELD